MLKLNVGIFIGDTWCSYFFLFGFQMSNENKICKNAWKSCPIVSKFVEIIMSKGRLHQPAGESLVLVLVVWIQVWFKSQVEL